MSAMLCLIRFSAHEQQVQLRRSWGAILSVLNAMHLMLKALRSVLILLNALKMNCVWNSARKNASRVFRLGLLLNAVCCRRAIFCMMLPKSIVLRFVQTEQSKAKKWKVLFTRWGLLPKMRRPATDGSIGIIRIRKRGWCVLMNCAKPYGRNYIPSKSSLKQRKSLSPSQAFSL